MSKIQVKSEDDPEPIVGRDADTLNQFVKVCSHVAKEHKDLNAGSLTEEDIENMDTQEFQDLLLKALEGSGVNKSNEDIQKAITNLKKEKQIAMVRKELEKSKPEINEETEEEIGDLLDED